MTKDRSYLCNRLRALISALLLLVAVALSACTAPAAGPPAKPSITATPLAADEEGDVDVKKSYPILLEGHSAAVTSAEFSPEGGRVVTASEDGTAIVWDASTGTLIVLLQEHSAPLTAAHFDPTGDLVVTAGLDGTARVWDVVSGEELALLTGHEGFVNDARFDPEGERVVTAGEDGSARIWNARTGELLTVLSGYGGAVESVLFHPDGSRVATANDHSTVILWNAADGRELFVMPDSVLEGQLTNLAVHVLEFSRDGSRLISAGEDGFVNVWDTKSGTNLLQINTQRRDTTWADLSPDGNRIASAAYLGGIVTIWDARDGAELTSIDQGTVINDVAFDTTGTRVATVGSAPSAYLWDATSGERLRLLEGHTGPLHTVDFSPKGQEMVTASADGTARIWNISLASQEAEQGRVSGLSPRGPWWVLAGMNGLRAVNSDGSGAARISEHDFGYDVDITGWAAPQGGRIAYVTTTDAFRNAALHVISLPDLEDERVIPLTGDATEPALDAVAGDPALDAVSVAVRDDGFAWSPDGGRLAFTGMLEGPTSDVYLYDTASNQITRLTDEPTQASRPLWAPGGRLILYTALEGANIDTGMHVQAFRAVAADGSSVTSLNVGEDQLLGWVSADGIIVYSIDTICGRHNLRVVDLSAEAVPVWEGYFDHVAYAPESDSVLVAVGANTASAAGCNVDQGQGLFRTDIHGTAPFKVVEVEVQEIAWSPQAQLFFARTEQGILAVSPSGEFIDLAVPQGAFGTPQVAAGTRELAWRGEGLWLSRLTSSLDQPPEEIFAERTNQVQWSPSGSHLLFITTDGALYAAQRPEFTPQFIEEVGTTAATLWITP